MKQYNVTQVFTVKTAAFDPGDVYQTTMSFPDDTSFQRWRAGVNANNRKGTVPYKVL